MATDRGLSQADREAVDKCAAYLHYDQYFTQGLPLATRVIEGACIYPDGSDYDLISDIPDRQAPAMAASADPCHPCPDPCHLPALLGL